MGDNKEDKMVVSPNDDKVPKIKNLPLNLIEGLGITMIKTVTRKGILNPPARRTFPNPLKKNSTI